METCVHDASGTVVDCELPIILMATYKGWYPQRQQLPLVLKHFAVAVYPHPQITSEPDIFHLHTSPEWSYSQGRKQKDTELTSWLIAHLYDSKGRTNYRWKDFGHEVPDAFFTIGLDERDMVMEVVDERWESWVAMCEREPPAFLERCIAEYKVSNHTLWRVTAVFIRGQDFRDMERQKQNREVSRIWATCLK